MTTDNELTVRADARQGHVGHLESVTDLIEQRRKALDDQAQASGVPLGAVRYRGPAFVLHVLDAAEVLADHEARASIEHAARHGARCGVVVKLYGPARDLERVLAAISPPLLRGLIDGRTVQIIEPTAGVERPAVTAPAFGARPGEPGYLARTVLQGYGRSAGDYLAGLVEAGLTDHIAMAFLGRELRRAADAIDPEGGLIPCPLCLASPRMRPDEIEGHLVSRHAALSEAVRR